MFQIFEYVKMALKNIRTNKGRSFLTMLGIIIGISSVILIMSLGNGAKKEISDQLNSLGDGQIYMYSNTNRQAGTVYITKKDVEAIKSKVDHVKGATVYENYWTEVESFKGKFDVILQAGMPDLEYSSPNPVFRGRFFNESDYESNRMVCVITQGDARKLFGSDDVVGMSIEIDLWGMGTKEFKIIGIRKDQEEGFFNGSYEGQPLYLEIPNTALANYGIESDEFSDIYIFSEGNRYSSQVTEDAMNLLETRHQVKNEGAFLVQQFADQMSEITSVLDMLTVFIMLVAAISLLVGGIGVMNIMLVSVTERTREIGIRKGLGARTGSIMTQFLAESAIITAFGGLIGILIGVGGAYLICSILPFDPQVQPSAIIMATLFSCGVGIFFGIYPAKKAAKLSPIEALRRD